jgi:hypothetical protein
MGFASFLRFWAVAANRNSFLAPFGPRWAQSIQPEDTLQMSEEHLDLLSFSTRDGVGLGLCDRAGLVTSGLMNGARDLARRNIRAALGFEHASLAVVLARKEDQRALLRQPVAWLSESAVVFPFLSSVPPGQT